MIICVLIICAPSIILSANVLDAVLPAFQRFEIDLSTFIPVVKQEIEFANINSVTNDQAFEQMRSFVPLLKKRLHEMRLVARKAENDDSMCVKNHVFFYRKLMSLVRKIENALGGDDYGKTTNRILLASLSDLLHDWHRYSRTPCADNQQYELDHN